MSMKARQIFGIFLIGVGVPCHLQLPVCANEFVNNSTNTSPAPAQVEEQKEAAFVRAMKLYRHRMWADAAEDFGAALPSEFNNPLLHYYYANCMVHLKHKEAAIREYRIAYALQPVGTIGQYCKLCLDKFGIDAEGKKSSSPKTAQAKTEIKKPGQEILEPPSGSELAALKVYPKDGSDIALEREKSVQNLKELMQAKKRANGAPIPTADGTNLYVRSYKGQNALKPLTEKPATTNLKTDNPATEKPAVTPPKPQQKKFGLWWW